MKLRRFEFKKGPSDKFWEVVCTGNELTIRWGRTGGDGQGATKTFTSFEAAEAEADKLVRKKLEGGYTEAGARPKPSANRSIDPKALAAVQALWKRIDRWLERNAPPLLRLMGKPATREAIYKAEKALGLELPDDVRASCTVHDGSAAFRFFPSGDFLSLKQMVFEHRMLVTTHRGNTFDGHEGHPTGPIRKDWYNEGWVPLTHDGCGDHTFIDLAPAKGGKVGQLIDFGHEQGTEGVAAPSLARYLKVMADALESGAGAFFNRASVTNNRPYVEQYIDWPTKKQLARSEFPPPKKPLASWAVPPALPPGRYFERIESKKFWEAFVVDTQVIFNGGRFGVRGKPTLRKFKSPERATEITNQAVTEKLAAGYVERP